MPAEHKAQKAKLTQLLVHLRDSMGEQSFREVKYSRMLLSKLHGATLALP